MTYASTSRVRVSMTTFVVAVFLLPAPPASARRQMEALGRGVVAVRQADWAEGTEDAQRLVGFQ
jgi:hypothetical protein